MGEKMEAGRYDRTYRGDIYTLERDASELRQLGVEVGTFNARFRCFENCVVRPEVVARLRAAGHKFLCDLVPLG